MDGKKIYKDTSNTRPIRKIRSSLKKEQLTPSPELKTFDKLISQSNLHKYQGEQVLTELVGRSII